MRQRLPQFASLCSALLCLLLLVQWNRSRRCMDDLGPFTIGSRMVQAYTLHGGIHVYWSWGTPKDRGLLEAVWQKSTGADMLRSFDGLFGIAPSLCLQLPVIEQVDGSAEPDIQTGYTYLHLPLWLPVLMALVLPARWLFACVRQRRRIGLSLCVQCGYDLRASTERCPECGAAISQAVLPRQ